jgi:hypothetical protein
MVALGPEVRFVRGAAVDGDLIVPVTAVRTSTLPSTAFLGGIEVAPLLRMLDRPTCAIDVLGLWSRQLPPATAATLLRWALERNVLAPEAG